MTKNDGGPAFPSPALANEAFYPSHDMGGMSLRDWFAGQAFPGFFATGTLYEEAHATGVLPIPLAAKLAFIAADAMIAARDAS